MPAIPFTRLIEELQLLYKPPHRRKSTWLKLRKVLHEFADLPGVRKTTDITPLTIISWVDIHRESRKPITNRSYLSAFHEAVKYAKKMGYLKVDPWEIRTDWITRDMEFSEEDEEDEDEACSGRHHPIEQIVAFLDLLDSDALLGGWFEARLQALAYTYALSGLRKNEALGLRKADVNLAGRIIRLKPVRRRTLKTRNSANPAPICPELHAVLSRWLPICDSAWLFPARGRKRRQKTDRPWLNGPPGQKALDEIKAAGTRSGIGNLTIQSLRRSIATHGRRMGLSLMDVRDLLRHTDARTTQAWYIENDAPSIADLADRISYRKILAPVLEQAETPLGGVSPN
jgi:integrase